MPKSFFISVLVFFINCSPVDQKETVNKALSAEQKALYNSWKATQCYYEERPFGVFLVNRNDTFQEEFIKVNGMLVTFDVAWLTDSTYTLAFRELVENPQGISLPMGLDTLVRTCWMTQVKETSYIEAATSNMTGNKDTIYTTYIRPDKNVDR